MGIFIEKVKNKIYEKYKAELKKQKERFQFESNKIKWSTIRITPGTEFMHLLNNSLISDEFKKSIEKLCKNIKKYIFSGPYEPGEGEKKIVDFIRNSPQKRGSYVVYSPDSDVILLCLLLNTKLTPEDDRRVTKLTMLRHNQQKGNYDVIDIDTLSENLFSYAVSKMGTKGIPDKDSTMNDIVFLLTIFGNDFVPKVESFNVRQDFDRIIDKYIEILKTNRDADGFNYLVDYNYETKRKVIDQNTLFKIIKELQIDEGGNLQKMYMSSHYRNYNKLKKIMDADQTNFTQKLSDFLFKLRLLNSELRNVKKNDYSKFLDKWLKEENEEFISKLNRLTRLGITEKMNNREFLEAYIEYFVRNNKIPKVAIYFRRYLNSLRSDFHRQKLEKSLDYLDPKIKITSYDEEIYKFDNMLDEYQKKLNAYALNLGYVSVDPNTYVWKTEKISNSVKKYYKRFFDIDDINVKNSKMKNLVQEYIDGLVWVFEFYFNDFDEEKNRRIADVWFYPFEYAPLFTQIYYFFKDNMHKKDFISSISKRLRKYKVDRPEYFNCLEHLMYVSPAPYVKEIIPKEYYNFAEKSAFYPSIDEAVDNFWKNPMSSEEINCRGKIFLNKCHLEILKHDRNFEKDKVFIGNLRKIKLQPDTKERKGEYREGKSNIIIVINLDRTSKGGYYKIKYLEYKKLYNYYKHKLI